MNVKVRSLELELEHILLIVANIVLGVVPVLTSALPAELAAKLAAGLDAVFLVATQVRKALEARRDPIAAAGEGFVMGDPTNTPIAPPDPVPPPAAIVAPVQTQ